MQAFLYALLVIESLGRVFGNHNKPLRLSDYNGTFKGDPDVFLIGVQKAGTSSIHSILVYGPSPMLVDCNGEKEPQFFSNRFNNSGFSNYIDQFNYSKSKQMLRSIDSTPDYFAFHSALDNMLRLYDRKHFRSKQFVLVLRDPTARLHSWYQHLYGHCYAGFYLDRGESLPLWMMDECNIKNMREKETEYHDTFEDWVNTRADFGYGYYLDHIKRWLNAIPRKQLFIINMEVLLSNSVDTTERLFKFLGYKNQPPFRHQLPHLNEHCRVCKEVISCTLAKHIQGLYAEKNNGLIDFINSGDRPTTEPHFPEFTRMVTCI